VSRTAQSREAEAVAVLPAVVSNASAGEWQVRIQGGTILQPILSHMREAVLNQQHAPVFQQQRALLAEFNQSINYQRAAIAALPLLNAAAPWIDPFLPKCWPSNVLRLPKEE
jgi:hypothetical protein